MTVQEILNLIQNNEKRDVEFHEIKNSLTKDIFNTICAFNNRNGGHILLGVDNKRVIVGVSEDKVNKIIKEFAQYISNSQKLNPAIYPIPEVFNIDGKNVIHIGVPVGINVCRHNGIIWDRIEDYNIDITYNAELVYKLYTRKKGTYFVNKVYPNLNLDFLNTDIIDRVKNIAVSRNKNHVWKNMNHEELLRSADLILTDHETMREGITLAAILLFGKDNSIMSVLPHYKTDAICSVDNKDWYDDRDIVTTNLIDSYDRLLAFGQKHLNHLFVKDEIINVNARDNILREIVSNSLIHRDYFSVYPAKMIISDEDITIENSNYLYDIEVFKKGNFDPFIKNPTISNIFREIGLTEGTRTGIKKINKYAKLYSGIEPEFIDDNTFRTVIPLKKIATLKVGC